MVDKEYGEFCTHERSRTPPLKLSESLGRTCSKSLRATTEGTFRAFLPFVYQPNSRLEGYSYLFSGGFSWHLGE